MSEKQKRRFVPRFSLKLLLIFALVTSVFFGWFAPKYVRAKRESAALEALADLGPEVFYNYQRDPQNEFYDLEKTETPGLPILKRFFGDKFFCHAEYLEVYLYSDNIESEIVEKIGDFRQLKELSIRGSPNDLSMLAKLKDLEKLSLDCYDIPPAGLEPLARLRKLKELTLESPSDLDGLAKLTTLERLNLDSCSAPNIESLSKLENLRSLTITGAHIAEDLSPIGKLAKLESLELSLNGFKDHGVLGTLPRLKKLNVGHPYGGYGDWKWLGEIQSLEELDLSSSRINKFPSLAKLQNLKKLDVTYCSRLESSGPIVELKNLSELSIGRGTPMQIIDEIEKLPKLQKLHISQKKGFTAKQLSQFNKRIPNVTITR